MCSEHEAYAKGDRLAASQILGVIRADAAAVVRRAWAEALPDDPPDPGPGERGLHEAVRESAWRLRGPFHR